MVIISVRHVKRIFPPTSRFSCVSY